MGTGIAPLRDPPMSHTPGYTPPLPLLVTMSAATAPAGTTAEQIVPWGSDPSSNSLYMVISQGLEV